MKKIIIAFITFLVFSNVNALEINSENAVLYNLNDNKVIYEKDSEEQVSIASLTKIMTVLVAIENTEDIKEDVTITWDMLSGLVEKNLAVMWLYAGEKVTVEDLMYGTLIKSAADATKSLAITVAGSEEEFVRLMNEKAKSLGLTNTKYSDVYGLDDVGNTSTPKEIATLLMEALKNETFNEIFYTSEYTFSNGSRTITSSLHDYIDKYDLNADFILGAKTGYTDKAGKCLASVAYDEKNDIKYMLVTTGADTTTAHAYHVEDAINVYNYYMKNYGYQTFNKTVASIETKYSSVDPLNINMELTYYLENDYNEENFSFELTKEDLEVSPFTKVGTKLGTVDIYYQDEIIDTKEIILEEKIGFNIFVFIKDEILLISIVLISFVVILFMLKKLRKKKIRRR